MLRHTHSPYTLCIINADETNRNVNASLIQQNLNNCSMSKVYDPNRSCYNAFEVRNIKPNSIASLNIHTIRMQGALVSQGCKSRVRKEIGTLVRRIS